MSEVEISNGNFSGWWRTWFENGNLEEEGCYGELGSGTHSGRAVARGVDHQDSIGRIGIWKQYYESGELRTTTDFGFNAMRRRVLYARNGDVISETSLGYYSAPSG